MKKKLRHAYVRLLRSPGGPSEIAAGMALGLFIAVLPVIGLQMSLAVALAELVRRLFKFKMSRVAAAAGVWLTNPLTAPPIYWFTHWIGWPLVGFFVARRHGEEVVHHTSPDRLAEGVAMALELPTQSQSPSHGLGQVAIEGIAALTVGGILLGVPLAFLGYHLTRRLVQRYHARKVARQARARVNALPTSGLEDGLPGPSVSGEGPAERRAAHR